MFGKQFGNNNPRQAKQNHRVSSMDYSPDGKHIIFTDDNVIIIYDLITKTQVCQLKGHRGQINSIKYSPNGLFIASGGSDNTIKIWSINEQAQVMQLLGHSSQVISIAYSPDGNQIASSSRDFTIRIWNVNTGLQIGEVIKAGNSKVQYVNNFQIICVGLGYSITVLDVRSRRIVQQFANTMSHCVMHCSVNGQFIASCNQFDVSDKALRIQNRKRPKLIRKHGFPGVAVDLVRFSLNQQLIVFNTYETNINVLEVSTGQLKGQFRVGSSLGQTDLICTQDGSTIISGNIFDGIRTARLDIALN